MAANTDKFIKVASNSGWQVGAAGVADASVTTVPLVSANGLPTGTAVLLTIDRVDSSATKTPAKMERIIGVVSGNNIINCIRGIEGTAQAHSGGAVVEIVICATNINKLIDGILVEHNQDGTHILDTDVTLAANSDVKIASQKAVKTYVDAKPSLTTILQTVYPVGSIYISTASTNPSTLFGFGTWAAFAAGRTLIGVGTSDQAFTAGTTGGESTHLLTAAESGLPAHSHTLQNNVVTQAGSNWTGPSSNSTISGPQSGTAGPTNASSAHNNLQPYIVTYMWKRTA